MFQVKRQVALHLQLIKKSSTNKKTLMVLSDLFVHIKLMIIKKIFNYFFISIFLFLPYSFAKEKVIDICKLEKTSLLGQKIKCTYKYNNTIKYLMIKNNEECFTDLKFINPKKKQMSLKPSKFSFGFSSLSGASIGISLDLEK